MKKLSICLSATHRSATHRSATHRSATHRSATHRSATHRSATHRCAALRLSALALALAAGACAEATETAPRLELGMTATIPAGAEVEYCQFVTVPPTWVTRDAVELSPGSHHALVYQTPYAALPTHKKDGTPVDTSGTFDCSAGPQNDWEITKVIAGTQNPTGESILAFPEGVGVQIGGVLLMDVHYRNASDAPLAARVTFALDTAAPDQIAQEGDVLFLYNPLIVVPPGGASTARWRCPVYRDITIANAQSHMHARGVHAEAQVNGDAPFYVNDQWENVPVSRYEHLTVPAGARIDYRCDYRNTGGVPIYQGPRTTDEMCVLVASYYPADPRTTFCFDESGQLPGGEWIGQGAASCAQTLSCLEEARSQHTQTDCMLAASPAVSRESSELFRCFLGAHDPEHQCAAQIAACTAR